MGFLNTDIGEWLRQKSSGSKRRAMIKSVSTFTSDELLKSLNSTLPLDVYFRLLNNGDGYKLYIYSLPINASASLNISKATGDVSNENGEVVCVVEELPNFLLNKGLTTIDTSDDMTEE